MSRPLEPGASAPPIVLPGIPGPIDSARLQGSPYVIEFLRGTW